MLRDFVYPKMTVETYGTFLLRLVNVIPHSAFFFFKLHLQMFRVSYPMERDSKLSLTISNLSVLIYLFF